MIGKTSMKIDKHLHTGMQNRYSEKYLPQSYSRMIGIVLLEGTLKKAQEKCLLLEARLHNEFGSHRAWHEHLSGSLSGKPVKKGTEATYYFVVYLALKEVK